LKTFYLLFLGLFICGAVRAQAPANDNPDNAILVPIVKSFCSNDGAYTSSGATSFFTNDTNKDVWFKFTAVAFDVSITVTANGTAPLNSPGIDLYTYDANTTTYTNIVGSPANGGIVTTYYKGALTIGQTYYFRVYGRSNNTGTFKLCINNYNPVLQVGQDYVTASVLCSKASFTQTGVTGAGANNRESAGTCLDYSGGHGGSIEANTAWYKWTAANNGTLTFTITPTVTAPIADDIDWVLYDLGTTGDPANVTAANAIRCDASRGVDCVSPQPIYYKTGLRAGETQTSEPAGCNIAFTGYDKPVDMIQGHVYALLINNFSNGNNGVTIDFGGTGEFVGPTSAFTVVGGVPCTAGQVFTFTNQSANYSTLRWTFGENATPATATGVGPFLVTYSTPGQKTAVLEAIGGQGCIIVSDTTFTVGVTPPKPTIDTVKKSYCLLDTMILSTPTKLNYTYQWTGPNNFSSTLTTVSVPLTAYSQAGKYVLQVTQFGCASDTASIAVVSIGTKPVDDFTITANNLCTPQQSFTIVNNSTNYTSLQWDYGSGANAPTVINANTVNVTYNTYGVKTVTLTATGSKGCVTVLSKTLTNPMKPATPVISKDKPLYCTGDSIALSVPVQAAGTTYLWAGPNNYTSTKAVAKILARAAAAGTYTLVITQGLCSSDAATFVVNTVDIIPVPVASFTANPSIPSTVYFPNGVTFTNTSTNADSYLWSFGDGTTSTDVNPVHYYQKKGDYTVTLTATNQGTCNNSVSKGKISLRYNVIIFIPNTFTPNDDAVNDDFRIKMVGIKTFHLQIFNRFGTRLFESTNLTDYWKGTYKGSAVPVGTYYYLIDLVTLNDDKIKESGSVTVVR
jgi:gliding motility-associated-like protein